MHLFQSYWKFFIFVTTFFVECFILNQNVTKQKQKFPAMWNYSEHQYILFKIDEIPLKNVYDKNKTFPKY